ncbi:hypothetical protein [Helicobacter suis]|uniref:hypothetical protein n=1 Tax=Helicobacter suis TaxID=104628 RepID=UPI0019677E2D|nr:hypothetical protein [Helicobacter suis]
MFKAKLHVLKRHGKNGVMTRARKQPPVRLEDIAKYPEYANQADFKTLSKNKAALR